MDQTSLDKRYTKYVETLLKIKDQDLKIIYSSLLDEYYNDPMLVSHRTYIENNQLGYGEKPFHVVWREIVKSQQKGFKFLEIGVYKGQVLSLVKLLSDHFKNDVDFCGVSPLDTTGDKFSKYDSIDYRNTITSLFNNFNLDFNFDNNFIVGDSTSESVKDKIKQRGIFDVIYIDGCHDYDCVVSDINLMKSITKVGSIVVFDDASCYKELPENNFKGHQDVCEAVKNELESDDSFLEIICVGHNRIFKKIN